MKRILHVWLMAVAGLCTVFSGKAYDFEVNKIYFKIVGDEVMVTNKNGGSNNDSYSGSVYLPSSVSYNGKNYPVTSIGDSAFYNCQNLEWVTIGNKVKTVGKHAFQDSGITGVDIPTSVTQIGDYAFYRCGLTSVLVPSSVTSVGNAAFGNCYDLTSVKWSASSCSNAASPFVDCRNLSSFVFGSAVEQIPAHLCEEVRGLTSVTVPEGITAIGEGAFSSCTGLVSVVWNARACTSEAESSPFENCYNLSSITFGETVEQIPAYLCKGLRALTSVTISESVTHIGNSAFASCSALTSVTIPESVTSLGSSAFESCSTLASIKLPSKLTRIEESTFASCYELSAMEIPASVETIGNYAFMLCRGLKSVVIPNSVKTIDDKAFLSCSSLTSVTIPQSMTYIDFLAFWGCTALTTVEWNAPSCEIYAYQPLFGECPNITTFIFGDGVRLIPANLCAGLSGLTTLSLPSSLTSIGKSAFSGCSGLTSVTIPDSVTTIGEGAFSNCTGLASVEWNALSCSQSAGSSPFAGDDKLSLFMFGDGVKLIPANLCAGLSGLSSLRFPLSLTGIGKSAFSGCPVLTSVTIPDSVTTIGEGVFSNCPGLASVEWNARACTNEAESSPFEGSTLLSTITFGPQVEQVPAYLCAGVERLTLVTLPESVKEVGARAFADCTELTRLTISGPLERIGERAFLNCTGLTLMTLPESLTSIGEESFAGCTSLVSITLPEAVTSIGALAFSNCTGLTSLRWEVRAWKNSEMQSPFDGCVNISKLTVGPRVEQMPDYLCSGLSGLTSIVWNAQSCSNNMVPFSDSPGITSFTFGSQVEQIPDYLCSGLHSVTSIELPESLKGIGVGSFYDCTGLSSFTIPSQVTRIGEYALAGCTGLESITSQAELPPVIASSTFDNYEVPLYVPSGSKARYAEAEYWRNFSNMQESGVPQYTVEVYSSDETMGSVLGGGVYDEGSVATLAAIPKNGYQFVQWSDGNTENPRQITVTGNITLSAEFEEVTSGLTELTESNVVYVVDRMLHVDNGGEPYRVYTTAGRLVYTGREAAVPLTDAGIYVVRTGSRTLKVVVR